MSSPTTSQAAVAPNPSPVAFPAVPPLLDQVLATFNTLVAGATGALLALRFALSTVVANLDTRTDPSWGMIVAPSSSSKTEVLNALSGLPSVFPLSDLTPKTLASGMTGPGGLNVSLIHKLSSKTLVLKDFTTVLAMRHESRGEILAQLREIYDGDYRKQFGNGATVNWRGRMGLLAGVTEAIDQYHSVIGMLGERFLYLRFAGSDERDKSARKALSRSLGAGALRGQLVGEVAQLVSHVDILAVELEPQGGVLDTLSAIADFVTRARTVVVRDHSHQLLHVLSPEGPARFAKQIWYFSRGSAALRGSTTVDSEDLQLTCVVAANSMPPVRWMILSALATAPNGLLVSAFDENSGRVFGRSTRLRALEDLELLGLIHQWTAPNPANPAQTVKFAALTLLALSLWQRASSGGVEIAGQGSTP